MGTLRFANRLEMSCCSAASTFTHSCPLRTKTGCAWELRFMQTSSVGGWSVTLQTAVAVMPAMPATPSGKIQKFKLREQLMALIQKS